MADIVITITEALTLNGTAQGATNKMTISSVDEVSRRIVTCPIVEKTLMTFGSAIGAGQYVAANVRYIRITNKDNTDSVALNIEGNASTDFSIRLDPGASYLIASDSTAATGVVGYADITGSALEDLTAIKGTADTNPVDLEIFVASA